MVDGLWVRPVNGIVSLALVNVKANLQLVIRKLDLIKRVEVAYFIINVQNVERTTLG